MRGFTNWNQVEMNTPNNEEVKNKTADSYQQENALDVSFILFREKELIQGF
jgi:hypothetical protein